MLYASSKLKLFIGHIDNGDFTDFFDGWEFNSFQCASFLLSLVSLSFDEQSSVPLPLLSELFIPTCGQIESPLAVEKFNHAG